MSLNLWYLDKKYSSEEQACIKHIASLPLKTLYCVHSEAVWGRRLDCWVIGFLKDRPGSAIVSQGLRNKDPPGCQSEAQKSHSQGAEARAEVEKNLTKTVTQLNPS